MKIRLMWIIGFEKVVVDKGLAIHDFLKIDET
jgi:hypothetical protein